MDSTPGSKACVFSSIFQVCLLHIFHYASGIPFVYISLYLRYTLSVRFRYVICVFQVCDLFICHLCVFQVLIDVQWSLCCMIMEPWPS